MQVRQVKYRKRTARSAAPPGASLALGFSGIARFLALPGALLGILFGTLVGGTFSRSFCFAFTRRLVTARHGSNRVNPEELKKEIQETKKVADINWLLSKVEELEKKK